MKLTSKKDIEGPIDQVWAAMSDFEAWERSAMRRGADVSRTDALQRPGAGMAWLTRFIYRGKERKVEVKLTEMTPNAVLSFDATSTVVEAQTRVELIEMSAKRTRIHVMMEVKPKSLGGRLFMQSLRLARTKLDRKFDSRIDKLASEMELRLGATARR
jgi:uncharacterized protein YndB with AHSA1/START domain